MIVEFINQSQVNMPRVFLKRALKLLSTELVEKKSKIDIKKQELSIVFLDPKSAQQLNFKYRKKNYPTDVLSFKGMAPSLGELILCPQVLKQQAKDQKHSFRNEVLYMCVHGVLHLLGYEHETNQKDADSMFSLQDELYTNILQKITK